jgi:hypothetical protein
MAERAVSEQRNDSDGGETPITTSESRVLVGEVRVIINHPRVVIPAIFKRLEA